MRPVLFDLDGTLTDPRVGITRCLVHALERSGAPVPSEAELLRYIGPPLHESFRELLRTSHDEPVLTAVAHYRERFRSVGMFENAVYPGVSEGLHAITRSGRRLLLATSKPTVFARPILEHFELSRYFDGIYGSELSGERADKAELIEYLLRTEGIVANEAVMVGDRKHDVLGARKNGVRALGVLWGFGDRDELVEAGAVRVCAHMAELVQALEESE
jgi:phosphoglycolate phosphatase